jgi:DNA (cytosine-5)-methyltransferase 1
MPNTINGLRGGVSPTLNTFDGNSDGRTNVVVFSHTQGLDAQPSETVTPTLRREGGGHALADGLVVRRLTPLECERLQGFPDEWTSGQSDSARYRQMGNAVAVPCVEWIVGRLVDVDQAMVESSCFIS